MKAAATGIVFDNEKNKVLIIQRKDVPVWALPGGAIENGESPEETVVREIQEETGYSTNIVRKVGEYYPTNQLGRVTHVYECVITDGKATLSDETNAVGLYPIDALPEFFFPVHRHWISHAKDNNPQTLHLPIPGLNYWQVVWHLLRRPMLIVRFLIAKKGFPFNKNE